MSSSITTGRSPATRRRRAAEVGAACWGGGGGFVLAASGLFLPEGADAGDDHPLLHAQHRQASRRRKRRHTRERRREDRQDQRAEQDKPRGAGETRGIAFEVSALGGILGKPVDFWAPQAGPSRYLKLKEEESIASFNDFSTKGPRALLWMARAYAIVVELSASGDPEVMLAHRGSVDRKGWDNFPGGRILLTKKLAVGDHTPLVQSGDGLSIEVNRVADRDGFTTFMMLLQATHG